MSRKNKIAKETNERFINLFNYYYDRFIELSTVMFKWNNMPNTVDVRFMEITLLKNGMSIFFKDDVIGYLALQNAAAGPFNVYNIPTQRRAIAANGYQQSLDENNSVIIYNNYLHNTNTNAMKMYSRKLAKIDMTIDINVNAQKTPILVKCSESQRLTMETLYDRYDGDHPYIFGDNGLNAKDFTVLSTSAPYVADKLYELKNQVWNEALTYLGISNVSYQKKERMVTDEVTRSQGGTIASRYSRLQARQDACKQINEMFGLNISCEYRDDYQIIEDGDSV